MKGVGAVAAAPKLSINMPEPRGKVSAHTHTVWRSRAQGKPARSCCFYQGKRSAYEG
jgi:hypothetical protein